MDPDLAWVCAQHDLTTDFRGHITFEDVQRGLCLLGHYARQLDVRALADAALAQSGPCDESAPAAREGGASPPRTIRDLYSLLKVEAARPGRKQECVNAAFLTGMVGSLGRDYAFRPIGEITWPNHTDEAPTPSLLNHALVYVRVPGNLVRGQTVIEEALRAARQRQAVRGLVLDLRGSDGASVQDLARLLDLFFDDGVVMAWRTRLDGHVEEETATRLPVAETIPMAVIVDEKTTSGAEAVAGVLRARGRAVLIGRRTEGHALVQTALVLPSGSQLLLPIGDLLEPGVGVITGRGVKPDFELTSGGAGTEAAVADPVLLFATRLLLGARSNTRADLLESGSRATIPSLQPSLEVSQP